MEWLVQMRNLTSRGGRAYSETSSAGAEGRKKAGGLIEAPGWYLYGACGMPMIRPTYPIGLHLAPYQMLFLSQAGCIIKKNVMWLYTTSIYSKYDIFVKNSGLKLIPIFPWHDTSCTSMNTSGIQSFMLLGVD
jgi:hypothetical protein